MSQDERHAQPNATGATHHPASASSSSDASSVPERRAFRHLESLRVRWAEVDLQHIVFNGHYLMYFDTAVAGYWRAMAVPYHAAMQLLGGDLYVRKATVEYLASARYDDGLRVGVRTQRMGRTSMQLSCAVFRGEQALVHGELVYVFANPSTQTSQPLPDALRAMCTSFERGDDMVSTMIGEDAAAHAAAMRVRESLRESERAALGVAHPSTHLAGATHVVLVNRLAMPVAAAGVMSLGGGECAWEGLAIDPGLRGERLLGQLLQASVGVAARQGARALRADVPHGLVNALTALGFVATTPVDDARVRMTHAVA